MPDLSAGTKVQALDFPPAKQLYMNTTVANISDTSYVVGDPEVSVSAVCPTSGRFAVVISGGLRNNAANADRLFLTFRVYEGDPADNVVIQQADVKYGLSNQNSQTDDFQYAGHMTLVEGLTPGTRYYFRMLHKTTLGSGTADLSHRHILVWPVP